MGAPVAAVQRRDEAAGQALRYGAVQLGYGQERQTCCGRSRGPEKERAAFGAPRLKSKREILRGHLLLLCLFSPVVSHTHITTHIAQPLPSLFSLVFTRATQFVLHSSRLPLLSHPIRTYSSSSLTLLLHPSLPQTAALRQRSPTWPLLCSVLRLLSLYPRSILMNTTSFIKGAAGSSQPSAQSSSTARAIKA